MEQEPQQPAQAAPAEAPQDRIASLADASKTLNHYGAIIFFVILAEIVLLFGLNLYQQSRFRTLSGELDTLKGTLASSEYSTLNQQVEEVISGTDRLQSVLDSKVRWANFYTQLNAITPKDVKLSAITVSADGSFRADGETSSMTSLAKALVTWNTGTAAVSTPFSAIKLSSNGFVAREGGRRVSFTVAGQIRVGALR